jgi:hypothetical protein
MLKAIQEELTRADLSRLAESADKGGRAGTQTVTAPGPHRKLASRVKSIIKFVGQPDFDQDFDEVASELAALLRNPKEDLENAADYFEALADTMRKVRLRME